MTARRGQGDSPANARGPAGRTMRLNRYLALCGAASRRGSMDLIFAGRVRVNGEVARDPGKVVCCGLDCVELDGEHVRSPAQWLYFAFHKPRGIIVSMRDEWDRAVMDTYLSRIPEHVLPIGRLDRSSEGLLLLTNHGDLAHALLHPRRGVEKIYRVRVFPRPGREQLQRMADGVPLGGGERSAPARVRMKRSSKRHAVLSIALREGKKREVRRICRAVGLRVLRLRRVAFAGIRLGDLTAGAVRPLLAEEVAHLKGLSGLEL